MEVAGKPTSSFDITADERAVNHLVGALEGDASRLARAKAKLTLDEARFKSAIRPTTVAPTPEFPHGSHFVDLSIYQPHVDLAELRKASSFVVFKATEGLDYTDGFFVARWQEAAHVGFPNRGAYHFLHMDESGEAQAEYFLHELDRAGGVTASDVVVCDAEITSGQSPATVAAQVTAFGTFLAAHCPAKRWLYTGGPFAQANRLVLPPYQGHWLPCYGSDPKPYYVFGTPVAWQYTDGQNGPSPRDMNGVTGAVDISVIL